VRVVWQGPARHTAATLLAVAPEASDAAERDARAEAVAFLEAALANGPRPAARLLEAARRAGLAEKTVRRAKVALGVEARKDGARGGWWWGLPRVGDRG
jgi:putative DNA primase/helicase